MTTQLVFGEPASGKLHRSNDGPAERPIDVAQWTAEVVRATDTLEQLRATVGLLHNLTMNGPDGNRVPVAQRLGEPMRRLERTMTLLNSATFQLHEVREWVDRQAAAQGERSVR